MEDDSENMVFYDAILKNLKIISSVFWSFPFTYVSKIFSGPSYNRTSKLEIILTIFAVITTAFIFYHSFEFLRRILHKLYPVRLRGFLFGSRKSNHQWEYSKDNCYVYAIKGRRAKMEDRFSVIIDKESGISLYGIFDGHGGEFASEFVEKHLFKELLKKLQEVVQNKPADKLTSEFARILTDRILEIDIELLAKVKAAKDVAGTTALVAILFKNQLIVANVGDSRGVICDSKGNAIPLSFDHKPDQLKERRRIHSAGGFISFHGVWRVAGILATSRALGDFPLKDRNLVIARPDILNFDLEDLKPQFMILATDGLWDAFTNEESVDFVKKECKKDFCRAARALTRQAFKSGSSDNITVLVVDFSQKT